MKKTLILLFIVILCVIFCVSCGDSKDTGTPLFSKEDVDDYAYGVIYAYHNVDAIVQLYASDGSLIRKANMENVRGFGLCSSSTKPYVKYDDCYYYVSDAAFDPNLKNSVVKLNPKSVTYERIELSMENNFTYDFSIDAHDNVISAYYSGSPEFGCVYETAMKNGENQYYAFNTLENYEAVISSGSHFWPLDAIHCEDLDYFIGYITNQSLGSRTLAIGMVKKDSFDILCHFNGYLYAKGFLYDNDSLYVTAFDSKDNAKVMKYHIPTMTTDASLSLDYKSSDVKLYQWDEQLLILNCDMDYPEQHRKAIYTTKELRIEETYDIAQPIRICDISSEKIVCSDTENIYVYDHEWNQTTSFAVEKEPQMKFSGIFFKQ